MGNQRSYPGLVKRGDIWHVDKSINRKRMCKSTGTSCLEEAKLFLAKAVEDHRQATVYGVRPSRSFSEAADKFILENGHKKSIRNDKSRLKGITPWIGQVKLDKIHMGTLQPWIAARQSENVAVGTINHGLKLIRHILNLAADEWTDDYGLTWLLKAPKIRLLEDRNKRKPYPLKAAEQKRLLQALPAHLANMVLFAVHTGCRDQEICQLRWEWERTIPRLETSVFIIPGSYVKNGDDRLIILNKIARSIIEGQRGKHDEFVFTYERKYKNRRSVVKNLTRMFNSAWLRARTAANLPSVRVHDLRHTFATRLRHAGVSFEDRQDLLGHRSHRITTQYSATEVAKLLDAANLLCEEQKELIVLRDCQAA